MENTKNLTVKALASIHGVTIRELAREIGVSEQHLANVSAGTAKMTAYDLIKLAETVGVDPFQILIEKH